MGAVRGRARVGPVVGEIVVVFDGGEGCGFAEEAEVVDGDRVGEDGLEGFGRGALVR